VLEAWKGVAPMTSALHPEHIDFFTSRIVLVTSFGDFMTHCPQIASPHRLHNFYSKPWHVSSCNREKPTLVPQVTMSKDCGQCGAVQCSAGVLAISRLHVE
jgi:hypothetical protein